MRILFCITSILIIMIYACSPVKKYTRWTKHPKNSLKIALYVDSLNTTCDTCKILSCFVSEDDESIDSLKAILWIDYDLDTLLVTKPEPDQSLSYAHINFTRMIKVFEITDDVCFVKKTGCVKLYRKSISSVFVDIIDKNDIYLGRFIIAKYSPMPSLKGWFVKPR